MVLTAIATSIVIGLSAQGLAPAASTPTQKVVASATASTAPTNTPASGAPVFGDQGDDVVRLQQAMVVRGFTLKGGVDGVFSPRTQTTLRNMQKAVGLRVTGIVDEPTARFLGLLVVARLTPDTLPKVGDSGDAVWSVQQALINNGVTVKGGADASFGVATIVALSTYQSRKGLPVTKTLDWATAFSLGLVDVAPPVVVAAPVAKPATTPAKPAAPVVPVAAPVAVPAAAPAVAATPTQLDVNALPKRGERS
ncbi:MAG: peptidoglycan-binding protein, partial [Actinomycetota bacterium]